MKDYMKCPYCGFESDICDFPDYFTAWEDSPIIYLLQENKINIVTCGMCGKAIVDEVK